MEKLDYLIVIEDRWVEKDKWSTGIYVRALTPDGITSADIATLTPTSLLKWLQMDGGSNPLAENTVGVLLGHGHLH